MDDERGDEPVDLDPDVLAGLVLSADLVPRPVSRAWANTRALLRIGLAVLMEEGDPPVPKGFLVVTRMDNGAAVRLTRSDHEDGALLAYVRQQLAELTVGEFLDRWGVDPADLRAPAAG
ncbi:hypothetical protein Daura_32445 [Dactylosporangium aurantiacum]|uniref:Uncharacterized protein n=1 Tax=Dactylosporangium aurantiacum TaxID=35754 RepID=A0A9Q9MJ02_9ACTN|nr:hypothetical protein [Dactylosporangium aurantiacum]MDG6107151.1 hypothetical protein [Dactylosporangium aurantiacum]UWZ51447.1 hypothetical protein Daura_32445 [Dactylosporangium aurantiacum]